MMDSLLTFFGRYCDWFDSLRTIKTKYQAAQSYPGF